MKSASLRLRDLVRALLGSGWASSRQPVWASLDLAAELGALILGAECNAALRSRGWRCLLGRLRDRSLLLDQAATDYFDKSPWLTDYSTATWVP